MKFKKEISINLSAQTLADVFINWDSKKQSDFINLVGLSFKRADFDAELQCCYISDEITKFGKDFIYTLANFVKATKFLDSSPHFDRLITTYKHDTLR